MRTPSPLHTVPAPFNHSNLIPKPRMLVAHILQLLFPLLRILTLPIKPIIPLAAVSLGVLPPDVECEEDGDKERAGDSPKNDGVPNLVVGCVGGEVGPHSVAVRVRRRGRVDERKQHTQ